MRTSCTTVARPWGTYTVLEEGPGFKIKRIEVKPGASLSLQLHHHRSEHWVVVRGTARRDVRRAHVFGRRENESTFIPVEHEASAGEPGDRPLVMIEVQCGDYIGRGRHRPLRRCIWPPMKRVRDVGG